MMKIFFSMVIVVAMNMGTIKAQDTKTEKEIPKTEQTSCCTIKEKEQCCNGDKKEAYCKDEIACKEQKKGCYSEKKNNKDQ